LSILDASLVDVYQATHAVIITISPFSADSLDYARCLSIIEWSNSNRVVIILNCMRRKEAKKVPSSVAILFLLNFRCRYDTLKVSTMSPNMSNN
jgi:hypothetical protein